MSILTDLRKRVMSPFRKKDTTALSPVSNRGWQILESFGGAWQRDVTINMDTVNAYWAVFSCTTLVASDIAKMPPAVMAFDREKKIWTKTSERQVLQKPNRFQNHVEFKFNWMVCQLRNGNTYVLKERDPVTGFIIALYILDPCRVNPLIATDGSVWYELMDDTLAGLEKGRLIVPASEIIHDRMYPLFHPLVGLSPLYAAGVAAMQGAAILNGSTSFFGNRSMPGGILIAPGAITQGTADRLKAYWDANFTGANAGKVAVVGDGLKFEAMATNAEDAQLIDQLKMTGEMVCACFHVPPYKLGLGQMPTVNNVAALNQQYYDQCLQYPIEKMELRLDEGLELPEGRQIWLDTSALLRMDPVTRSTTIGQKVKDGVWSPDEARRDDDLPPVEGGATPYLQQQNYSLAALAARDAKEKDLTDVQKQALNGGQVTALQGILNSVTSGQLPVAAARATIAAAFPELEAAELDAMTQPLQNFEAKKPEPPKTPPPQEPSPSSDEEPDEEKLLAHILQKAHEEFAWIR